MKSSWIGIGFSHHRVPSLSNTATRSSTGTLLEPSWPHVRSTNWMIACLAGPSFQLASCGVVMVVSSGLERIHSGHGHRQASSAATRGRTTGRFLLADCRAVGPGNGRLGAGGSPAGRVASGQGYGRFVELWRACQESIGEPAGELLRLLEVVVPHVRGWDLHAEVPLAVLARSEIAEQRQQGANLAALVAEVDAVD